MDERGREGAAALEIDAWFHVEGSGFGGWGVRCWVESIGLRVEDLEIRV